MSVMGGSRGLKAAASVSSSPAHVTHAARHRASRGHASGRTVVAPWRLILAACDKVESLKLGPSRSWGRAVVGGGCTRFLVQDSSSSKVREARKSKSASCCTVSPRLQATTEPPAVAGPYYSAEQARLVFELSHTRGASPRKLEGPTAAQNLRPLNLRQNL